MTQLHPENLKRLEDFTPEELSERGRKGGIASGEAKRKKKLFKEEIEKQLKGTLGDVVGGMITQALNGNVQAATFLRDTIGEKPSDKVEHSVSYEDTLKGLTSNDEY